MCVPIGVLQPITSSGEIVQSETASLSQQRNRRFGLTLMWTWILLKEHHMWTFYSSSIHWRWFHVNYIFPLGQLSTSLAFAYPTQIPTTLTSNRHSTTNYKFRRNSPFKRCRIDVFHLLLNWGYNLFFRQLLSFLLRKSGRRLQWMVEK